MEYDRNTILEVVRLIGDGKNWDALELLKRETTDEGALHAIDMAQFEVELPF